NTISNLTIVSNQAVVGLFGAVGASGIVENIGLVGGSVTGTAAGGSAGAQFGTGGANVGALVGYNQGTIANAYATTPVVGGNAENIGGLVGWNEASGNIHDAFATGAVSDGGNGGNALGGLVGWNKGTIENAYATGSVSGSAGYGANSSPVGGLVGYFNGGTIENAYAAGMLTSGGDIGGLFGNGGGTVTNAYYNADTTGQPYDGVAGLHTADMQTASFATTLNNGGSNWAVIDGVSYPYLTGIYATAPQIVSGTVVGNTGGTAVTGIANGAGFGTATTGANGYYYFQLAPGTLGSSEKILTYVSGSSDGNAVSALATVTSSDTTTSLAATGLNLVSSTVNLYGQGGAVALSDLTTAKGALTDGGILYSYNAGTNTLSFGGNNFAATGAPTNVDANITTTGGQVTFNGPALQTANVIVDTSAGGTNAGADITFNGATNAGTSGISLTLNAGTGGTVTVGDIGVDTSLGTYGNIILDGAAILLGGNINTAGGQVTFNGATTLNASGSTQSIDTTNGGDFGGATITFNGTLDDSVAFSHTLTLAAGTAGDIYFNGRVGANNPASGPAVGFTPGGVIVTSAEAVNLDMPLNPPNYDGFHVGQFVVEGTGNANCTTDCVNGAGSINPPGSYISTYNPTGNGGAVTLAVSGSVEVGYDIFAAGGMSGTTGKNGGKVTIVAGGSVQVGDAGVIAGNTSGSGAEIIPNPGIIGIDTAGWFTGFASAVSNQTAGDGGNIYIVAGSGVGGGSINLPFGAFANGGSAIVD